VSDGLGFDPGLYRGTAGYYDRFRVRYPQAMLEALLGVVEPSGHGRLLDGVFELAAIGNAFPGLRRAAVAADVWRWLRAHG
jgi:hypothetical protein